MKLLELAKRAAELYRRQSPSEKRKLLDFVVSNATWKGGEPAVSLRQPFDTLAKSAATAKSRTAAGVTSDGRSGIWLPNGDGGENFEAGFSLVERRADDAGDAAGAERAREPGVYRLLRLAEEFRRLLDTGEVESRAELARRAGLSRARVTQVMGVWRLHRPVVEHLRAMAARGAPCVVGEHEVRALVARDEVEQDRWARDRLPGYCAG